MIPDQETADLLGYHFAWVDDVQDEWRQHRAAYEDKFGSLRRGHERLTSRHSIEGDQLVPTDGVGRRTPNQVQVNLVRPFVAGFLASLRYRGIRFAVEPDQLRLADQSADPEKLAGGVKALVDRWFATEELVDIAETVFIQGLLYRGGCAIALGRRESDPRLPGQRPTDRVWVEVVPPWEAVWDRRSTSRNQRYRGRLRWESLEVAKKLYGAQIPDTGQPLPDVVRDGFRQHTGDEVDLDQSYVQLFEFWDLTATTTLKGDDGKEYDTIGQFRLYLVEEGNHVGSTTPKLVKLKSGPIEMEQSTGAPLIGLIPAILEPHPDYPHDSISAVRTVYLLNAELNHASSVLADAFRRDAARIILYLAGKGLDSNVIDTIMHGGDLEWASVESETLEGLFKEVDLPPISTTLLQYIQHLSGSLERTQSIASQTRGEAGEYLTATEVGSLVDYTNTTIGRIRSRTDLVFNRVAKAYLGALAFTMYEEHKPGDGNDTGPELRLALDTNNTVTVQAQHLTRHWQLQVIDAAATPAQRGAQLVDFMQILPALEGLSQALGLQEPMARAALDHIVEIGSLPQTMTTAALDAAAPAEPPPDPAQAGLPPVPGPPTAGPPVPIQ